MIKTVLTCFGMLFAQTGVAEIYNCRANYTAGKREIFKKEFIINSGNKAPDGKPTPKHARFDFINESRRYFIDCGVVVHLDQSRSLVCGLNAWNEPANAWDTVARAVTEVGAPMLAVLHSNDEINFDINCQLM